MTIRSYSKSFLLGVCLLGAIPSAQAGFLSNLWQRMPSVPSFYDDQRKLGLLALGGLAVAGGAYAAWRFSSGRRRTQPANRPIREPGIIREFNPEHDDVTAVHGLLREAFAHREDLSSWVNGWSPTTPRACNEGFVCNENIWVSVLRENDQVAGMIHFDNTGYIHYLGVGQDYRRRGYARQLLNYEFDRCRRLGLTQTSLHVETNPRTEPAYNLYRTMGFRASTDASPMQQYHFLRKPLTD